MSKIFQRTFRVRFSECDAFGQVSVSHLLRYLAETAYHWGAANGIGMDESINLGLTWVMRETEIDIYRPFGYNESVEFSIWLLNWRRVRRLRGFNIRQIKTGELLAQGTNQVACLNSETLRPTKFPHQLLEKFLLDDPPHVPHRRFPRSPQPPEGVYRMHRRVEWRDLDMFDQINHAVFVDFAEEAGIRALAETGWSPAVLKDHGLALTNRRVHIQYQKIVTWGHDLEITTFLSDLGETGGVRHVIIKDVADGLGVAELVVDWNMTDLETGKSIQIPEKFRRIITSN